MGGFDFLRGTTRRGPGRAESSQHRPGPGPQVARGGRRAAVTDSLPDRPGPAGSWCKFSAVRPGRRGAACIVKSLAVKRAGNRRFSPSHAVQAHERDGHGAAPQRARAVTSMPGIQCRTTVTHWLIIESHGPG